MAGKKLRSRLFGFKKSDVFGYIYEMDQKAETKLAEKDKEILELKDEIAELQKNREAIINVLQIAEANAKELVKSAQVEAEEILDKAEKEAYEKKELLNREIEIKRRAVKNYYINENKKIEQIRVEVERMRENSIEAIKRFEQELIQIGRMTANSRSYVNSAMDYAENGATVEPFEDAERVIPVHIVESIND
jgi:cell division septum initiation protein DivIVA